MLAENDTNYLHTAGKLTMDIMKQKVYCVTLLALWSSKASVSADTCVAVDAIYASASILTWGTGTLIHIYSYTDEKYTDLIV